jgi:hypothetical protein
LATPGRSSARAAGASPAPSRRAPPTPRSTRSCNRSPARATHEVPAAAGEGSGAALSLDGVIQSRLVGDCPDSVNQLLVVRVDGAWLCFRATDLNLLRAPPTTFYQRRLFPMRLDDITGADLGPLRLRREGGMWRITAPTEAVGPARDEAVRAALEPLLAAEARTFATTPLDQGTRVRLTTRDDEVTAVVSGSRARRSTDNVTLELGIAPDVSLDVSRLQQGDLGATPF